MYNPCRRDALWWTYKSCVDVCTGAQIIINGNCADATAPEILEITFNSGSDPYADATQTGYKIYKGISYTDGGSRENETMPTYVDL